MNILNKLKKLLSSSEELELRALEHTPTEHTPTDSAGPSLWDTLATNRCPDCGHEGFYEGPSGGLSTNIECANRACRSRFNVTPIIKLAERI